jgi:hypothetical protein
MSSPTGLMTREPSLAISVTRTSTRPTRRSLSGGTELLRAVLPKLVPSTPAGVISSALSACAGGKDDEPN